MVSTSYRGCEIFSVALSLKKYDSSQFKVHLIHRLTVLSHTLRCANFFYTMRRSSTPTIFFLVLVLCLMTCWCLKNVSRKVLGQFLSLPKIPALIKVFFVTVIL